MHPEFKKYFNADFDDLRARQFICEDRHSCDCLGESRDIKLDSRVAVTSFNSTVSCL